MKKVNRALFTIVLSAFILFYVWSFFSYLSEKKQDVFVEKTITIVKVEKSENSKYISYVLVDDLKNTYLFDYVQETDVFNSVTQFDEPLTIRIQVNLRNNIIKSIYKNSIYEKNEWIEACTYNNGGEKLLIFFLLLPSVALFFLLKKAISDEWFWKRGL